MSQPFEIIALDIKSSGQITANNLPQFQELLREALGRINRTLETDEQFGQAEQDVKTLAAVEKSIREAAAEILDQGIAKLFREATATAEEPRLARLELEKLITAKKIEVKTRIVADALALFDISPALAKKHYLAGMEAAIVGKRTVTSMQTACEVYQVSMQAEIKRCRELLREFEETNGKDLTMDRDNLQTETPTGLAAELRRRLESQAANAEAKRLKVIADEKAAHYKAEMAKAEAAVNAANEAKAEALAGQAKPKEAPPVAVVAAAASEQLAPPNGPTEADELRVYKAIISGAFAPLKVAKHALTYPKNIAKAQIFANAVNTAWKESF
jgi:DNA-binding FrmR family transcriptional regulator